MKREDTKTRLLSSFFIAFGLLHFLAGVAVFIWPDWAAANIGWIFPLSYEPHPIFGHLHGSSGIYGIVIGICVMVASIDLRREFFYLHVLAFIFALMALHKVFMLYRINGDLSPQQISYDWPHLAMPVAFGLAWIIAKPTKSKPRSPTKKIKKLTAIERKRRIGLKWTRLFTLFYMPISKLPRMQKWMWKRWYSWISKNKKIAAEFTFMNFGHRELTDSNEKLRQNAFVQLKRQPMSIDQQNMARLYYFSCQAFGPGLEDAEILEVGSGRGGGARMIVENYPILNYIGVDLSPKAVAFCNETHAGVKRLHFECGDAEDLPLVDESRDVVINIESSHCYPNFNLFLDEVNRVLVDGGHFIFADFRPQEEMDDIRSQLEASGFAIVDARDITENIIAALDHDSGARNDLIKRFFPSWTKGLLQSFAGVKGSAIYESFCAGKHEYWFFVLRKTTSQIAEVSVEFD